MEYVISDIHGDYEKYQEMLKKIHFTDRDNLYVLGDVVDRGDSGMKILLDMMMRQNVFPIKGNHEYMMENCLEFLMKEVTEEAVGDIDEGLMQGMSEWIHEGGAATINEFKSLDEEERDMVLEYLGEFALYDIVKAGGKVFVLVHAGLDNFAPERDLDDYHFSEMLFHAPDYDKVYFEDAYLVTGHLPTFTVWADLDGKDMEELPEEERRYEILEKNNHIAIDCGCGYGGKLGCICLDTMEKFYV